MQKSEMTPKRKMKVDNGNRKDLKYNISFICSYLINKTLKWHIELKLYNFTLI